MGRDAGIELCSVSTHQQPFIVDRDERDSCLLAFFSLCATQDKSYP